MPPDLMPPDGERDSDLSFGDFTIVRGDERLVGPEGPVKLGRKAYKVLVRLAEQDGQLLTKDALFESVWDGMIVSESALTSVIKELRRALGDTSVDPSYIESVYGRGYRLLPPVTRQEARPPAPRAATSRGSDADSRRMGEAPLLVAPPFDDAAIAASDPHLGAILHEEVIIALSRFRDIRLVSDAGSADPRAAVHGERDYRLGVRLIRDGDEIRAFARITRFATSSIIWAEQMSLGAANPMHKVEEIARRVAVVALPRLHDDVLLNLPPQPDDAYDQYFLNRLEMRSLDSLAEARAMAEAWERLITDHPRMIQAYPPLIRLYNTDYSFTGLGAAGDKERRRAYALIHRAIALDPTNSHLHTVKGWCHLWAGEPDLAREDFEQAAALNPWHQARLIELATGFMFLDDLDRAAGLLKRCAALTAFAGEAPHEEEGLLHLLREDYAAASGSLALARRTHPDDSVTTGPSILTEYYALLAAAGSGDTDLSRRAADWRAIVAARWAGDGPPDIARLRDWAMFHNPFQNKERRQWLLALTDRALAPPEGRVPRTDARARRGKGSAPPPAGPVSR
jgi:DNA-binding winged helix-turn-helix (wHTH) protein